MREPVLFGTCVWIAREFGWDITSTRFIVAALAVLDPTFFVGLVYVVVGLVVRDTPVAEDSPVIGRSS